MSYITKPSYIFRDKFSTGVAEVPINSLIIVNDFNGKIKQFFKNDSTISISNTNTIEECFALNAIKEISNINYIKTSSIITLSPNDFILADSSSGAFSLTLPLSPLENSRVTILDAKGTSKINNITILRNGSTIMGLPEDMIININNLKLELVYTTGDWRII